MNKVQKQLLAKAAKLLNEDDYGVVEYCVLVSEGNTKATREYIKEALKLNKFIQPDKIKQL